MKTQIVKANQEITPAPDWVEGVVVEEYLMEKRSDGIIDTRRFERFHGNYDQVVQLPTEPVVIFGMTVEDWLWSFCVTAVLVMALVVALMFGGVLFDNPLRGPVLTPDRIWTNTP